MKSRICLCNGTILKKDLTRFAPLVLLEGLVLWAVGAVLSEAYKSEYGVGGFFEPAHVGVVLGAAMGLFSAVLFFTYLTKKKECDAIHSLPLRRETLFFTKMIGAFLQVAVPFGIFFAFFPGERGWLFQMTLTLCSWIFSFGLAVLSMMLSGRWLAGYILYSVIEGLPGMVVTIANALYIPLLPGVYLRSDVTALSPITQMASMDLAEGKLSEILLPMLGFALLGAAFLVAALVAYRKRKLERAGDFLVVKWLEPVFSWLLGIYASIVTISIVLLVEGSVWVGLAIGLTIGYFAARMFFARSIKVFRKKNLAGWLALVAFMAASLYVTSLDPMGLVDRIPETDRIESVGVYDYDYPLAAEYGYEFAGASFTTQDPDEIDDLRRMHRNLLLTNDQEAEGNRAYHNRFYLVYKLKNGSEMIRTYYILGDEDLKQLKYYMSQPEGLVGSADVEEVIVDISELYGYGVNGGHIHTERAFLEVFLAECEAGLMYSPDPDEQSGWDIRFYSEIFGYRTVDIPLSAEKTVAWLENYFGNQR